jgi:polysaccharide deacetylase 2 family uncharacterized protein YibQ
MFSLAGQRQGLARRKSEAENDTKAEDKAVARGFLSGVMWGSLLSLGVAGTVSVFSDGPQKPDVSATAPDAVSTETQTPETTPSVAAEQDTVPDATAPETMPAAQTEPAAVVPDTAPTSAPEVAAQSAELSEPAQSANTGALSIGAETPAPVLEQGTAPQAPSSDATASVSTEPAQPVTPQVSQPEQSISAPETETIVAPQPEPAAPAITVEETEPAPAPTPDAEPDVDTAAADLPPEPVEPEPEAPEAAAPAPEQTPDVAQAQTEGEQPQSTTGIGTPASDLSKLAPNVATNRLPTLGDTPQTEPVAEIVTGALDFNTDLPPIQRFAAPFENPDEKPLMAIVLMDDGSGISGGAAGADALSSFPYPVTFAIDTSLPNAAEKMARYRADGFEVMALVNLPEASTATDTEVSMSVALNALPEAVAVLEGSGTGIQGNREMSDQVTAILADAGMGLVTQPKGLNTVQKLASRDGVPAATLFRDFDGAGQDAVVIRRFLDQAAFKAGQEGGVIMVGRLRPDTISALLLWGLQDRAGRIALAPVSAVLTAQ